MPEPADQLAAEALKPASGSVDGISISRRSLTELMDYEKHQAAKAATASPAAMFKGMTLRIVPPGGS